MGTLKLRKKLLTVEYFNPSWDNFGNNQMILKIQEF